MPEGAGAQRSYSTSKVRGQQRGGAIPAQGQGRPSSNPTKEPAALAGGPRGAIPRSRSGGAGEEIPHPRSRAVLCWEQPNISASKSNLMLSDQIFAHIIPGFSTSLNLIIFPI